MEHFLVRCPELDLKRDPEIFRITTPMTSEEQTTHILFEIKQYQKVAKMIRNMWEYRKHRKYNLRPPEQKRVRVHVKGTA